MDELRRELEALRANPPRGSDGPIEFAHKLIAISDLMMRLVEQGANKSLTQTTTESKT